MAGYTNGGFAPMDKIFRVFNYPSHDDQEEGCHLKSNNLRIWSLLRMACSVDGSHGSPADNHDHPNGENHSS